VRRTHARVPRASWRPRDSSSLPSLNGQHRSSGSTASSVPESFRNFQAVSVSDPTFEVTGVTRHALRAEAASQCDAARACPRVGSRPTRCPASMTASLQSDARRAVYEEDVVTYADETLADEWGHPGTFNATAVGLVSRVAGSEDEWSSDEEPEEVR